MPAIALTIGGQTEYLPDEQPHLDTALRRYWGATQAGDQTARMMRVAAPPPTPPEDPDDDPPPAAPGAVSRIALERIRLQESWLAKAGFAVAPPIYAPGTRVLPLGDRNFRLERQRVERLPTFPDAAGRIAATIEAERRVDVDAELGDLSLTDYGTLMAGENEYALELPAFGQLALLGGFGMGTRYLAELCDAELRAENVNAQLKKAKDRRVLLRTRTMSDEAPQVYATVTPTYAAADTDEVLRAVAPALADARVEMLYDGTGARATALWMPDEVVDLAAGDIFKVGVRVETDDTGRGRIRIAGVVFRNRCLNLLVIGEGTVETVSLVHRGDPSRILDVVGQGVERARATIGEFLAAWGHARAVKVDPEATIRRWVEDKKLLPTGPRDRDAIVEAMLRAWRKEPGDTLADAVNAVTRAAHEEPTWPYDFREELERRAARLVLVLA